MKRFALVLALIVGPGLSTRAVEIDVTNIDTSQTITYNTLNPDNPSNPSGAVSGWDTGWGTDSHSNIVTGWSYVGQDNGASATYLGNGWVITAAHVGAHTFTLKDATGTAQTYDVTYTAPAFTRTFLVGSTPTVFTSDLTLFRISGSESDGTLPDLPPLTINTTDPFPPVGSSVVMVGYGGVGKAWGQNVVTNNNQGVGVDSYGTVDFSTAYTPVGTGNNAVLVSGDSGGGDFVFNTTLGIWELAGINEAVDTDNTSPTYNSSYMVQLSNYYSDIVTAMAIPEPGTWALLGMGLCMLICVGRSRSRSS